MKFSPSLLSGLSFWDGLFFPLFSFSLGVCLSRETGRDVRSAWTGNPRLTAMSLIGGEKEKLRIGPYSSRSDEE